MTATYGCTSVSPYLHIYLETRRPPQLTIHTAVVVHRLEHSYMLILEQKKASPRGHHRCLSEYLAPGMARQAWDQVPWYWYIIHTTGGRGGRRKNRNKQRTKQMILFPSSRRRRAGRRAHQLYFPIILHPFYRTVCCNIRATYVRIDAQSLLAWGRRRQFYEVPSMLYA